MSEYGTDRSETFVKSLREEINRDLQILSDHLGEDMAKVVDRFVISRITLSLAEMMPQIIEYLDRDNVTYRS